MPKQFKTVVSWIIGSSPGCHVVVSRPGVAGSHVRLIHDAGGYRVIPLSSQAQTFLNGKPLTGASPLTSADTLILGQSARMPWPDMTMGATYDVFELSSEELVIGSDATSDLALSSPHLSGRHARIRRSAVGFFVKDLDTSSGTFVNGRRVMGEAPAKAGDRLSLGGMVLTLSSLGLERPHGRAQPFIEIRHLCIDAKTHRLLDNISFTVLPGELVAIIGSSGAGKTTLLNAMRGHVRSTEGDVLINGSTMSSDLTAFNRVMGFVPQDDIMHRELTVSEALRYTALLRLTGFTSDADADAQIEELLKTLGIQTVADCLIGSSDRRGISGGQRKRVNLAMELLANPPILYLDEPTSGLSSEDARRIMVLLRRLADTGKSIVLTIHQPDADIFRLVDQVAVIAKDHDSSSPGRLAYYGPAFPDAFQFLAQNTTLQL